MPTHRDPWDPNYPEPALEDFRRESKREWPEIEPLPVTYLSDGQWRRLYANMAAAYHQRIPAVEADSDEARAAALLSAAESRRTREMVQTLGDHLVVKAIEAARIAAAQTAKDVAVAKVEETGSHAVVSILDQRELSARRKRSERLLDLLKVILGGAGAVGLEQLVKFLALGHF